MDFAPRTKTRISTLLDNSRFFNGVNIFENIINIRYNKDDEWYFVSFDTK
jgi:hypothetical protein